MEAVCLPLAESAMDTDLPASRGKAKNVINRRPSGYWKVFSNWWRGRYAVLKTRPTVQEVIDWYHRNAASSWPAGQVPCLKAVLRQSKGLRPIDGLKEYFREYRKKRKQQGGLALKAVDDGSNRRSRSIKRRRGRVNKDSSDEEDMDAAEPDASDYRSSDEGEDEEEVVVHRPKTKTAADWDKSTAAVEVAEAAPDGRDSYTMQHVDKAACQDLVVAQSVYEAWQRGSAAAVAAERGASQSSLPASAASAAADATNGASSLPYMSQLHATAALGGPVHPALAPGIVPIAPEAQPQLQGLCMGNPTEAGFTTCMTPIMPYMVIKAVSVERPPPKLAAPSQSGRAASLPPLSSHASPVLGRSAPVGSPASVKMEVKPFDDHAGDCCSTGGGVPPGAHMDTCYVDPYPQEHFINGFTYEYPSFAPPLHPCYPRHAPSHHCCYRSAACPVAYPYSVISSASYPLAAADCSGGGTAGGASSSMSPWPHIPHEGSGFCPCYQRHPSMDSSGHHADEHLVHPAYPTHGGLCPGGMVPGFNPCMDEQGRCGCSGRYLAQAPCAFLSGGPMASGYACGARPEAPPHVGRPCLLPYTGYAYNIRHGYPAHLGRSGSGQRTLDVGGQDGAHDGETCSSSVSDHRPGSEHGVYDGQETGRLSPCSATPVLGSSIGQHVVEQPVSGQPMLEIAKGTFHPYPMSARGMATAPSVTSMANWVPEISHSPCIAAGDTMRRSAGGCAPQQGKPQDMLPLAEDGIVDGDVDASSFLRDAPATPASDFVVDHEQLTDTLVCSAGHDELASELHMEMGDGVDCGLELADGFDSTGRESIDQDLAFAWETFVACDTAFDTSLVCH